MAKRPQEIHLHSGRSSGGLLDPRKILEDAGLKKGDTFLDAGCGEGHFSIAASQIVGKNGTVYAFDIYLEGINKLKKESKKRNLENMHAVVADITRKIPLKDKTVDFCLLSDVLHGLVANQEVDDALKEITRVLKMNGFLTIVEFRKIDGPPGPPIGVRITLEDIEQTITPFGFKRKKILDAGLYHHGMVFKRVAE